MRIPIVSRIAVAAIVASTTASASGAGSAPAGYPNKPIRLITSSPPGSPPDVASRLFAEQFAARMGQPIVVDNRPGAIGTIALHALAKALPDGYTLGTYSLPHSLAPALLPKLPYDVERDFLPVAQLTWSSHVLVVRASSSWKSVPELIAHAKAQPGRITFASGGNATPAHISGELLKQRTGIDIRHVPYKGAIGGVTALLGEQVDLMFAATAASGPHIRSGRLRALATPAPLRVEDFPEVPTMTELGYTDFQVREWNGIVAPARTPREIVATMAAELVRIASAPDMKPKLVLHGLSPAAAGPEAFGRLIRSELERWGAVARAAGMRAD